MSKIPSNLCLFVDDLTNCETIPVSDNSASIIPCSPHSTKIEVVASGSLKDSNNVVENNLDSGVKMEACLANDAIVDAENIESRQEVTVDPTEVKGNVESMDCFSHTNSMQSAGFACTTSVDDELSAVDAKTVSGNDASKELIANPLSGVSTNADAEITSDFPQWKVEGMQDAMICGNKIKLEKCVDAETISTPITELGNDSHPVTHATGDANSPDDKAGITIKVEKESDVQQRIKSAAGDITPSDFSPSTSALDPSATRSCSDEEFQSSQTMAADLPTENVNGLHNNLVSVDTTPAISTTDTSDQSITTDHAITIDYAIKSEGDAMVNPADHRGHETQSSSSSSDDETSSSDAENKSVKCISVIVFTYKCNTICIS